MTPSVILLREDTTWSGPRKARKIVGFQWAGSHPRVLYVRKDKKGPKICSVTETAFRQWIRSTGATVQ